MFTLNLIHLKALLNKEIRQILSDKSVLVVAFFIPVLLAVLYGSGMRIDVKPVSVALVSSKMDDPITREVAFALAGSSYFDFVTLNNERDAENMMRHHDIVAYVVLPSNLSQRVYSQNIQILITVNGADAQQASISLSYLQAVLANSPSLKGLERQTNYASQVNQNELNKSGSSRAKNDKAITVTVRNWFNESNTSTWYLMSGQLIAAIALMAGFMTSIVIAREFERGTITGLLATNTSPLELFLSKVIPYYVLASLGTTFTILFSFIAYELPFRGSVIMYILTIAIYLYVSLLIGLVISAATKNQFLSSEYAVIVSFLPAILLSGTIFDLRAVPPAIAYIAKILPPVYAVESSRICMLSGGSNDILWKNIGILSIFALVLSAACYSFIAKSFAVKYKAASLRPAKTAPAAAAPVPEAAAPAPTNADAPAPAPAASASAEAAPASTSTATPASMAAPAPAATAPANYTPTTVQPDPATSGVELPPGDKESVSLEGEQDKDQAGTGGPQAHTPSQVQAQARGKHHA